MAETKGLPFVSTRVQAQIEAQADWFQKQKEADFSARLMLREAELQDLRRQWREWSNLSTREKVLRYWTADPDELKRFQDDDKRYQADLENIWMQGEASLKPQPEQEEINSREDQDQSMTKEPIAEQEQSWREEQQAKEQAIDLVNHMPGGAGKNQELLSRYYERLKEQHPGIGGEAAWITAADMVESTRERQTTARQQASLKLPQQETVKTALDKSADREETEDRTWGGMDAPEYAALEDQLLQARVQDADRPTLEARQAELNKQWAQANPANKPEIVGFELGLIAAELEQRAAARQEDVLDRNGSAKVKPKPRETRGDQPVERQRQRPALDRLTRTQVEQAVAARQDLQDKDLSGLDLSNLTFRHMNLSGSSLANVTARHLVMEDCFALATDFTGAQFDNSVIRNLNASGSCWNRAELHATPVQSSIFDAAMAQDLLISGESRTLLPSRTERHRVPSAWNQLREKAGTLLENMTRPGSVRQDLQTLLNTVRRNWNNWRESLALAPPISREEWRQSPEKQRLEPAQPIRFSENSFVKADLTGARFIGVDFHQNNFEGAILRDVVGIAQGVDITKQLERDSKRSQELANLREEGLARLGCKDRNANPEKVAKLTEALDRKLSEGLEVSQAVKVVLRENTVNPDKDRERERIPSRTRSSRGL